MAPQNPYTSFLESPLNLDIGIEDNSTGSFPLMKKKKITFAHQLKISQSLEPDYA